MVVDEWSFRLLLKIILFTGAAFGNLTYGVVREDMLYFFLIIIITYSTYMVAVQTHPNSLTTELINHPFIHLCY